MKWHNRHGINSLVIVSDIVKMTATVQGKVRRKLWKAFATATSSGKNATETVNAVARTSWKKRRVSPTVVARWVILPCRVLAQVLMTMTEPLITTFRAITSVVKAIAPSLTLRVQNSFNETKTATGTAVEVTSVICYGSSSIIMITIV